MCLHQFLLVFTHQIWPTPICSFQFPHFDLWKGRSLSLLSRWLLGMCRYLIGFTVIIAGGTRVIGIMRWSCVRITVAVFRTWSVNGVLTTFNQRCWEKRNVNIYESLFFSPMCNININLTGLMGVLSKTRIVLKKTYIRDLARELAIELRSNFNASTQSS